MQGTRYNYYGKVHYGCYCVVANSWSDCFAIWFDDCYDDLGRLHKNAYEFASKLAETGFDIRLDFYSDDEYIETVNKWQDFKQVF